MELEKRFLFCPRNGQNTTRVKTVKDLGKLMQKTIVMQVPKSREQTMALIKLEEMIMWAIAGIARRE